MLLNEIIYNLKNLRFNGANDETEISDAQWVYIVNYYRAQLIRQQQKAGQSINPFIKQSFEVNLKKISNCDTVSLEYIPKPIELHNYELITNVGKGYERTKGDIHNWMDYAKYTSKEIRWYIKDRKLRLKNYVGSNKIIVEGVWENPYEVEELKGTINPLSPYNFEYPISATMLDSLYKMIADAELKINSLPKDITNNSDEGS